MEPNAPEVFRTDAYGQEVASLLALEGHGERLMPLASGTCSCAEASERLASTPARKLFPKSRAPEAALAGLFLYFSCLDECHTLAQDIATPEGSFWHAILHRQEPDAGNSAYWFRRVGVHPVFPALNRAAVESGYAAGRTWDPFQFIDYCEEARHRPGSEPERIALLIQRAEWQLLFAYCAEIVR